LTFDGEAFAEEYMLADVEVDWDLPTGYGVRASHQTDGVTDDLLVCIPLPGTKRYRVSMLMPEELSTKGAASDGIAHGLEGGAAPQLHHIAGPRCFGSVTARSTATASDGCSSPETLRTSTRRPACRA